MASVSNNNDSNNNGDNFSKIYHLVSIYDFKLAHKPYYMVPSVYGKLRNVRKVFPVFFDMDVAKENAKKHIDRATQSGSTDDGKFPVIGIIIVEYKFKTNDISVKNITKNIYNDNGKRNYTSEFRHSKHDMLTYKIGEPSQLRGVITKRGRKLLEMTGTPEMVINKYIPGDTGFAMLNMSGMLRPSEIYALKKIYSGDKQQNKIQKAGNISKFVTLQDHSDNYNLLNCTNTYVHDQKNNKKYRNIM
jgi:hypothetical protein